MRSRSTLIGCLVIAMVLAVSTAAFAIDPLSVGALMLGNQLISDARTKPVDSNTVALDPLYNVFRDGKSLGSCVDTRTVVAAVCQGSKLVFEPGKSSRVDILGFELTASSPDLPDRVGMYFDPNKVEDFIKIRLLKPSFIEAAIIPMKDGAPCVPEGNAMVRYVSDRHPRFCKWQLPLETAGLANGAYSGTLRVFFADRVAYGHLKTKRKAEVKMEETPFKFIVLDPDYWARAVNDVQLQQSLKMCFGLVGGPPSIGQLALPVNPEVAQQMSGGAPVVNPAMQTPPAPAPAPQPVKEVQPQPPEKPVTLVLLCGRSRQVLMVGLDMTELEKQMEQHQRMGKHQPVVIRFRRDGNAVLDACVKTISGDRVVCEASGKAAVQDGDSISILGGK